jgi:hypothetical protein
MPIPPRLKVGDHPWNEMSLTHLYMTSISCGLILNKATQSTGKSSHPILTMEGTTFLILLKALSKISQSLE